MKKLVPLVLLLASCSRFGTEMRPVLLATTTSFQDTGLLEALLSRFHSEGGPPVKAIAVGTGEALSMGRRGDADLLVVHAPAAEEEFMAQGHGRHRIALWHNDFVIVGPKDDPAHIRGRQTLDALKQVQNASAVFVSRGDESGTHRKEQALFKQASLDPWPTYLSAGQGMAETLRIASEKKGYSLGEAERGKKR